LGGEVRCVETKESFPSGEIVSAMAIDKNSPSERNKQRAALGDAEFFIIEFLHTGAGIR
jgi:hypothetical protein